MPGLKIKLTPFPENEAVNDNTIPDPKSMDGGDALGSGTLPPLKEVRSVKFETKTKTSAALDTLSAKERTIVRQSLIRDNRATFRKTLAQKAKTAPRVTFINKHYASYQTGDEVKQEQVEGVDDWYEDAGFLGSVTMVALFIYLFCIIAVILAINFGKMTVTMWLLISHTFLLTLMADIFVSYQTWKTLFGATSATGFVTKMKAAGKLPSKPTARRRTNDLRKSQMNSLNPSAQQRKEYSKVGIVNTSHHHVSFIDFLLYHTFFFRIDYTINVYSARLRHLLICKAISWGYKTAYRWYTFYTPSYDQPVAEQVAGILLESSMMLGLTEVDEDAQMATFKFTNWWVPCDMDDCVSQLMEVNVMMLVVDLECRSCIYCEVNGEEWTDMNEVLQIVIMAHSLYYHVLIHLYSNWWYVEDPDHPFHAFGIYTLLTSSISIYYGAFFKVKESARWMLIKNAIRGIHYHHRADLERFSKYSRTARFLLKARIIAKKFCTPENLNCDKIGFESFFIASILHNVDHHMAARLSNPYLAEYLGPHKMIGVAWIKSMLDLPHKEYFVRSSFKNSKVPWVRAMYNELAMVDELYADFCHLGIRF